MNDSSSSLSTGDEIVSESRNNESSSRGAMKSVIEPTSDTAHTSLDRRDNVPSSMTS